MKVTGSITINPPLSASEVSWLSKFVDIRHCAHRGESIFDAQPCRAAVCHQYHPDGPGFWCEWRPSSDGERLNHSDLRPEAEDAMWLQWLIKTVFTGGLDEMWQHRLSGELIVQPEDDADWWGGRPWSIGTNDGKVWIELAPELPADEEEGNVHE